MQGQKSNQRYIHIYNKKTRIPLLSALSSNNRQTSSSICFCFDDVDDKAIFWLLVEGNKIDDTFSLFRSMSCPVESNLDLNLAVEFEVLLNFTKVFETGWNGVEKELAAVLSLIKLSSEDRKLDDGFFKRLRISLFGE